MPDLTYAHRPLAALPLAVREPSYAAQILTTTAWALEQTPDRNVTGANLSAAITIAAEAITGPLPAVVAETATLTALAQLTPSADVTHGEYALRLRAAARCV